MNYIRKALFVDTNGTELHEPIVRTVRNPRSNYTFTALEIEGYTPDAETKVANGANQTVTFIYTQN